MATQTPEEVQEAFYNFDLERTFRLHIDDIRRIVTEEGEPMHDVEEFMAEAQQFMDNNGMVDYRAFADMMTMAP